MTPLSKATVESDTGDYEAELVVVLGRHVRTGRLCKNVNEEDAMEYVWGYTAANDVSSREAQMSMSQWCWSKGFDGGCPLGK